jgi:hypothetical protein
VPSTQRARCAYRVRGKLRGRASEPNYKKVA